MKPVDLSHHVLLDCESGNYDNLEIISDNNRFYAVIRNFSIKNLVISGKYPIFADNSKEYEYGSKYQIFRPEGRLDL